MHVRDKQRYSIPKEGCSALGFHMLAPAATTPAYAEVYRVRDLPTYYMCVQIPHISSLYPAVLEIEQVHGAHDRFISGS